MSFPRYPKYKASGVEWAGHIPDAWTPMRLRFLLRDGYEGMKIGPFGSQLTSDMLDERGAYKIYGQENVIANDFIRGSRFIDDDKFRELAVYEIIPGDLLITMMGTSGRCDVVPSSITRGIMDSHLLRMRVSNSVRPEFARLLIDEAAYVKTQIQLAGKGTIMHGLNSSIVKDLLFFVPPLPEQTAIVEFLDRETAKIDELVAEQRRLMELLKEKRQAVISHAVTKGLNPHAPMKPSGIEWLGDVPEHWAIGPIKYFVLPKNGAIKTGPFGSHLTSSDMQAGPIKVYNQRSVIDGDFDSGVNYISDEKFTELANFETFPGDLLITTRGTIGRAAILPKDAERGILHPCLLRLQPNISIINTEFLKTLIQDSDLMKTQLNYLSNATTIEVIYSYTIASVIIPVPPLTEQSAIMQFLTDETAKLDTLPAEAQRAIDLLQERRTALISAAVTGQIDVRPSARN